MLVGQKGFSRRQKVVQLLLAAQRAQGLGENLDAGTRGLAGQAQRQVLLGIFVRPLGEGKLGRAQVGLGHPGRGQGLRRGRSSVAGAGLHMLASVPADARQVKGRLLVRG